MKRYLFLACQRLLAAFVMFAALLIGGATDAGELVAGDAVTQAGPGGSCLRIRVCGPKSIGTALRFGEGNHAQDVEVFDHASDRVSIVQVVNMSGDGSQVILSDLDQVCEVLRPSDNVM